VSAQKQNKKKSEGFPMFFCNPLSPNPCMSMSPDAGEPISVAISFDLLREKRAMMQKANFRYGKTKMDMMVRLRELPCVRRSGSLYRGRVVRWCGAYVDGKKKVMKKQRRTKIIVLAEK
jgi:hypothetical protein